jgi:general secretion pathway protein D
VSGGGGVVIKKPVVLGVVLGVLLIPLAGCAANRAYRTAETEAARGNWDQAVLSYSRALALEPENARYKVGLERAKMKAAADAYEAGKRYMANAQWDQAAEAFQKTLLFNPGFDAAAVELDRALTRIRLRDDAPSAIEMRKERARRQALAPPKLSPRSDTPIQMTFRDVPVGRIFEAVARASQINFLFDDRVDLNKPHTIEVGNVTLEKALDILMLQTKNFFKVIDPWTILVAPDTRQKRQEYEDQVIRTFYLSNGDTKQVVQLLRSLLNSRQIAENVALNSVSIKDTPDKVAIAERIIAANDKSKGEILIDVELMEVNRTTARNMGIDLSSKTIGITFQDGETSVPLDNLRIIRDKENWSLGPIPSVVLNFLRSDSDSKTLAKPQLRVTEGEKAQFLIGDRVPIPTTSFSTSQTIGGNIVPITSYTYQEVGIKLMLEPRVHHNKEVTLKIQVEVSQISSFVEGVDGTRQPVIGTRTFESVLRLKDGETNMLAGLIRRDESDARSGIPGVLGVPVLRRILGNTDASKSDTDIILTLTPYILRLPDITDEDLSTLWVGTEENMRLRGPTRNALGESPFAPLDEAVEVDGPGGGISRLAPSREGPAPERLRGPERIPEPVEETEPGEPEEDPLTGGTTGHLGEADGPDDEQKPPPGPAVVRMVPSSPSYRVGDAVVVEVRIENGTNVGSVPFHLRYNPQVLMFVPPAAEGPYLGQDGTGTVFLANDVAGGGNVVVGVSRMGGGEGVSGSGTVATFSFQAVAPGDCGFAFAAASVKDPLARNLPASFLSATVQVAP